MYFYFCLKISGKTILHRFLSKLFHNLGPPYANQAPREGGAAGAPHRGP